MLKSTGVLAACLVSLALFSGCGSDSSSVVYDSGLASGSHVSDANNNVVVVAYDSESSRELASTTVKSGTLLLDADSNPIDKEVTYKLIANSEKVSATAVKTVTMFQITDADGNLIDSISDTLDVNVVSPKLKSMGEAKVSEASMSVADAANASSLRGSEIPLTVNPDGSIDMTIEYKAGRTWNIGWTFTPANTGATGGN